MEAKNSHSSYRIGQSSTGPVHPTIPQSNSLAESMVKVSKNLIEKAVLQDLPWNQLLLDYSCTPISSEIPSSVKFHLRQKLYLEESFDPASQFYYDR